MRSLIPDLPPDVRVEQKIHAPFERVWQVVADFDDTYISNPFVFKSYAVSKNESGLGATRRCEFDPVGDKYTEERIVDWNDSESYTIQIMGGNNAPPVNNLFITMSVQPAGTEGAKVSISFTYDPKWGLVGKIVNPIVLKPVFRNLANGILRGLRHHIETGQTVESMKTLKAVNR